MNATTLRSHIGKDRVFDKHYCLQQYISYSERSAHQKFEPDLPFFVPRTLAGKSTDFKTVFGIDWRNSCITLYIICSFGLGFTGTGLQGVSERKIAVSELVITSCTTDVYGISWHVIFLPSQSEHILPRSLRRQSSAVHRLLLSLGSLEVDGVRLWKRGAISPGTLDRNPQ